MDMLVGSCNRCQADCEKDNTVSAGEGSGWLGWRKLTVVLFIYVFQTRLRKCALDRSAEMMCSIIMMIANLSNLIINSSCKCFLLVTVVNVIYSFLGLYYLTDWINGYMNEKNNFHIIF